VKIGDRPRFLSDVGGWEKKRESRKKRGGKVFCRRGTEGTEERREILIAADTHGRTQTEGLKKYRALNKEN
jgi:hypothetical protein